MRAEQFLQRWGIRCFYHFTDERNLPSIKANGGLLPLAELRRRGLAIVAPGGNEWSHEADAHSGVDEYVHLCFLTEHPMEYRAKEEGRIQTTRFLRVEADIMLVNDVHFTTDVANKSGVPLLTFDEAVRQMDFEVLYGRTDWKDPGIQQRRRAAKKYEILIPGGVPLAKIKGL